MKSLVLFATVAASFLDVHGGAAEKKVRPNILWILGDDLGVELGCYGNPDARTPNLDRLAAEGVRFSRFYTTAPVCSASRSAFMTGMYAQTIRAHQHRTAKADKKTLPEGVRLLTHWFRDAGYHTANVVDFPTALNLQGRGKTDWNFQIEGEAFATSFWNDLVAQRPFFGQVNFQEPHRTFRQPKGADPSKVTMPPFYRDHPVVRADWAAYLDSIAELDRKVGAVLGQLTADGRADDTIVVFFGDNGRCHIRDKQFCYEGGLNVPLIIRWPKNFPAPANFNPGSVDDRLLSAIDLAPTMLSVAGAIVPKKMQGRVFLGTQSAEPRAYVFGGRDRCDETELTIRTVRDQRFRYILNLTPEKPLMSPNAYKERQYPVWTLFRELAAGGRLSPAQAAFAAPTATAEELYDMEKDPGQLVNLANDPTHRVQRDRLHAALDRWRAEIGER